MRQEEVASVVVGMLPALDATRWVLSVDVGAAPAPSLLSFSPMTAAAAARDGFMASVGHYLIRKPSERSEGVPVPAEPAPHSALERPDLRMCARPPPARTAFSLKGDCSACHCTICLERHAQTWIHYIPLLQSEGNYICSGGAAAEPEGDSLASSSISPAHSAALAYYQPVPDCSAAEESSGRASCEKPCPATAQLTGTTTIAMHRSGADHALACAHQSIGIAESPATGCLGETLHPWDGGSLSLRLLDDVEASLSLNPFETGLSTHEEAPGSQTYLWYAFSLDVYSPSDVLGSVSESGHAGDEGGYSSAAAKPPLVIFMEDIAAAAAGPRHWTASRDLQV